MTWRSAMSRNAAQVRCLCSVISLPLRAILACYFQWYIIVCYKLTQSSVTCKWIVGYITWYKETEVPISRPAHSSFSSQYYSIQSVLGVNVPDFGRMFLTLNDTDLTQNTYIRSWTVTEIMAGEKCDLLAVPRTVPVSRVVTLHCACPSFSLTAESSTFRLHYQQMSQLQWIVIQ